VWNQRIKERRTSTKLNSVQSNCFNRKSGRGGRTFLNDGNARKFRRKEESCRGKIKCQNEIGARSSPKPGVNLCSRCSSAKQGKQFTCRPAREKKTSLLQQTFKLTFEIQEEEDEQKRSEERIKRREERRKQREEEEKKEVEEANKRKEERRKKLDALKSLNN
jgi:hypothetical protein